MLFADANSQYEQSIDYKDDQLVIIGSIDPVFVRRIKAAYQLAPRNQPITTFTITSSGGDVEAALDLGEFIFKHQLSVYIPELCLSSCANYLFTAGKEKVITNQTILGWHGGALQKNLRSDPNLTEQQLFNLQKKETDFFQLIKVDQRICTLGQEPPYNFEGFWRYRLHKLNNMGVKNIIIRKLPMKTIK